MDAFYASIEQRNDPSLRGRPVIVGGVPGSRGVVAACSYEARKFGIHSAMASSMAYRLCPQAVFIRPDFDEYMRVSEEIMNIFNEYTSLVEPLSLDEAYLDVTENYKGVPFATDIAREVRKRIYDETGLTASAGVSCNKFLAKAASEYRKPDGITVIPPEKALEFIDKLPIGKFYGVGKATEKRMKELGIFTGRDLKKLSREEMIYFFGKSGIFYHDIANGIDSRPVNPERVRKSSGREITFSRDIIDLDELQVFLMKICDDVFEYVTNDGIMARTVTLKVKYHDFRSITRSTTLPDPLIERETLDMTVSRLLLNTEAGREKVRLLGVSLSNFVHDSPYLQEDIQLFLPFEI